MTALETMGYNIVKELNSCSEAWMDEGYGGYFNREALANAVCEVMFGHMAWGQEYIRYSGRKVGHVAPKMLASKEEREKITKVIKRMEAKGIIKFSKSRKMAKPMMTADEWYDKVQKGEL